MVGKLLDRWKFTWNDIWEPLGAWESRNSTQNAPAEIYTDLYRAAIENFKKKPTITEQVEITNSPENALKAFRFIKQREFKGEQSIVAFFEDAYETIDEYGIDDLVTYYEDLVESFLTCYNLRYRLDRPFHLLVQLPWVYADIYNELNQINQRDTHLEKLMNDFEDAFSTFARTQRRRDLSTSIAKASNYAEGIAAARLKSDKGSLGQMCDELIHERVWPHAKVKSSLQELYNFCSDYPGVRHAGNKNSKLRVLNEKDTIIISALLIAYSGYVNNQINIKKVLTG